MSVHNLDKLFGPRRVAVVGAGAEPNQLGHLVLRNLVEADFGGVVYPVNPARDSVGGIQAYPSIADLPHAPADLLTHYCLEIAHARGIRSVYAETTFDNARMIAVLDRHGFAITRRPEDQLVVGERQP